MSGYVCECCGERTNLFSKGGGEVMSREFGVGFLGRVPVDGRWGVLVEEGRRPVYGGVEGSDGDGVEGAGEADEEKRQPRESGLLVDKYRSCSLCPVFEGITRQVVDIVDRDAAVTVGEV